MTSQQYLDSSKGETKFYTPDFTFITEISRHISLCLDAFGKSWCRVSAEQVENIFRTTIYLYYFRTHCNRLIICDREVPNEQHLQALTMELKVPRFMRDVAREFARPMEFGNCIYLPDLKYFRSHKSVISMFAAIGETTMSHWIEAMKNTTFEMVNIIPEIIRPVPLSFYVKHRDEIYSTGQLSDWRVDAVSQLRHIHWTDKESIQEPKVLQPYELYETTLSGRYVGTVACYVYTLTGMHNYSSLDALVRFPTESVHSKSPPQSNRISGQPQKKKTQKRLEKHFVSLEEAVKDKNLPAV